MLETSQESIKEDTLSLYTSTYPASAIKKTQYFLNFLQKETLLLHFTTKLKKNLFREVK